MTSSIVRDVGQEAAKAAPAWIVWGLTLNEWLALVSILYVIYQAAYLTRKWIREEKRRNGGSAD